MEMIGIGSIIKYLLGLPKINHEVIPKYAYWSKLVFEIAIRL